MYTPWGASDSMYVMPGANVRMVTTPGHGGYAVHPAWAEENLSKAAIAEAEQYGGFYWYEEDVAWAVLFKESKPIREWALEELYAHKTYSSDAELVLRVDELIDRYFPNYKEAKMTAIELETPAQAPETAETAPSATYTLEVDCAALGKLLGYLKPAIIPKHRLRVLGHVCFEASNGNVWVKATDLDTFAKIQLCEASASGDFSATLPYSELVNSLPKKGSATITFGPGKTKLKTPNSAATLEGFDSEEFPFDKPRSPQEVYVCTLPTPTAIHIKSSVLPSRSKDDNRPVLSGMSLKVQQNSLTAVCADGFRLAKGTYTIDNQADLDVVIPPGFINTLAGLPSGQTHLYYSPEYTVEKSVRSGYLIAEWPDGYVWTRLVEGNFPNYPNVIPPEEKQDVVWTVSSSELLSALNSLKSSAKDNDGCITLEEEVEFPPREGGPRLCVSVTPSKDKIPTAWAFVPLTNPLPHYGITKLNITYLLDVIKPLPKETTVEIRFETAVPKPSIFYSNSPATITFNPITVKADGTLNVVMPMTGPDR